MFIVNLLIADNIILASTCLACLNNLKENDAPSVQNLTAKASTIPWFSAKAIIFKRVSFALLLENVSNNALLPERKENKSPTSYSYFSYLKS